MTERVFLAAVSCILQWSTITPQCTQCAEQHTVRNKASSISIKKEHACYRYVLGGGQK